MKKNEELTENPSAFRLTKNNDSFVERVALGEVFKGNKSEAIRAIIEYAQTNVVDFYEFVNTSFKKNGR